MNENSHVPFICRIFISELVYLEIPARNQDLMTAVDTVHTALPALKHAQDKYKYLNVHLVILDVSKESSMTILTDLS